MRPIRIFKAETFRLAALFALLFLALTGALIGTVLWIVDGTQRSTLITANDADIATVINGFRDEGVHEAIEVVRQRIGTPAIAAKHKHTLDPDAYIVIEDSHGTVLVGNLFAVECHAGVFSVSMPPLLEGRRHRNILGRCVDITDGVSLFVGRDTATLTATHERIVRAFIWVALGTCGFAAIAGLILGRRFMARVDAIAQTCEAIVAGRLTERIPGRGRGDEWDRLARAINEMLDRISALLENLRQMSSDIAHDLRTPLTRLRNRLEDARARSESVQECSAAMSRAIDDTDQLLSIFAALLRISQVESGTRAQTFSSVCLSDLVDNMYQLYLPVAEDCRHALTRDVQDAVYIRGDEELLTQMFSNLIENAIHHTPENSNIHLSLHTSSSQVVVCVRDDGPGVPVDERDKVLRRFYRMAAGRSTDGHGLGLSLVAAIAQLHGAVLRLKDAQPGLRLELTFAKEKPPHK